MFNLTAKREMAREIEELKSQIAALTQGQGAPRQGWGIGLEQGKNQLDVERLQLEKAKLCADTARFAAQSETSFARLVVQALLFLNGVAALGVLVFIGSLAKDANFKGALTYFSDPLSSFSYGAAFAVITAVFAYLSQAAPAEGKRLWADTLRVFGAALALSSLLLFVGGVSHTEAAFNALGQWTVAAPGV
jgi:hypothetical protein